MGQRGGRRAACGPLRDGSAVLACLRQVGAVLGIAVLVAMLESASPLDPVAAFTDAWTLMAAVAAVSAAIALGLGRVRALGAGDVVDAAAPSAVAQAGPSVAHFGQAS